MIIWNRKLFGKMWLNTFSYIEIIFHTFIGIAILFSSLVKYLYIFFAHFLLAILLSSVLPTLQLKKTKHYVCYFCPIILPGIFHHLKFIILIWSWHISEISYLWNFIQVFLLPIVKIYSFSYRPTPSLLWVVEIYTDIYLHIYVTFD